MRLFSFLKRRLAQKRPIKKSKWNRTRLDLEALENRITPAGSVTINTALLFDSMDGNALYDNDGLHNGILTINGNLTIQNGGSINANDNWAGSVPNSSAKPPIVINVSGNLTIDADTAGALDTGIFAENRTQGGNGADITLTISGDLSMDKGARISSSKLVGTDSGKAGDITIQAMNVDIKAGSAILAESNASGDGGHISVTAGGNMILHGTSGATPGAMISSTRTTSSGSGVAGDITIDVTGSIEVQTGSVIRADNVNGFGGTINITTESADSAGDIDIDGIVSSGQYTTGGNTKSHGGLITIIAGGAGSVSNPPIGADLVISDTGVVSSKGADPGADRVHLQGCDVTVYGLVQSTGPGHQIPPVNHLSAPDRPDKPANSTGGVEIWAGHALTIDASGTHNGEIDADVGLSGGADGIGWIDLFAFGDIKVIGKTAAADPFAVHANSNFLTNDHGGLVTVKSTQGTITASGRALEADGVTVADGSGTPGGGKGGTIDVEALGNIVLDTALLFARGDDVATFGIGGIINVVSSTGTISWVNGVGDVRPTGQDTSPPDTGVPAADRGLITLQAAGSITTTGTSFPFQPPASNTTPTSPKLIPNTASSPPTLPSYVILPTCEPPQQPARALDFGDAPDVSGGGSFPGIPNTYPTLFANNGAYHVIHTDVNGTPDFLLGKYEDDETDGHPSADAKGDDMAAGLTFAVPIPPGDEDGISSQVTGGPVVAGLPSFLFPGETFTLHVFLTDPGGLGGKLNAWIDWNGDGVWSPSEQIGGATQNLVSGDNTFSITVPATAIVSVTGATTFARFRLSTTGGLSPGGAADADPLNPVAFGEVEDYKTQIFPFWTDKCAVLSQVEQNTRPPGNVPDSGNCLAIPDILVDVDEAPFFDPSKFGTLAPGTNSIQAAVNYINSLVVPNPISGVVGDINGDGFLLIGVTAKNTTTTFTCTCGGDTHTLVGRDLGGDGIENYVITNTHTARLNVFGNSVNMHAADPSKAVATIKSSVGKVTYLDIHTWDSNVAGVVVGGPLAGDKNLDLVVVKNVNAINNKNGSNTGVGIWLQNGSNQVQVTGSQHIYGNNIGIQIDGDNSVLRTNNEIMDNNVLGIKITGNNNEANDQDVGKSGHANGAGILVSGNGNNIHDSTIAYNTGYALKITGNSNLVNENDFLNNGGNAVWIVGGSNQVTNNNMYSNGGDGINVTGNSNLIKGNDVGDKSKGNGGDGIHVAGNLNTIQENNIFSSVGDGIDLTGDTNYIYKNVVGDKSKGGNGLGNVAGNRDGIRVTGKTNTLEQNTSNANKGYGFYISGATSTGNILKNNKSNTDSSGGGNENGLAEYRFDVAITNAGGNKKDNAAFASTAAGSYE